MKRLACLLSLFLMLLFVAPIGAQEIPKGVKYKTAPERVNAEAKSGLEQALAASEKLPSTLFAKMVVCGPMLWKTLKPLADRALLGSKPLIISVGRPQPVHVEARRLLTHDARQSFWRLLRTKYPKLRSGKVRKAGADEISYYSATTPLAVFAIEEPLFVIDTGSERFIAHFEVDGGKPQLFWIDLVGDLRGLKP